MANEKMSHFTLISKSLKFPLVHKWSRASCTMQEDGLNKRSWNLFLSHMCQSHRNQLVNYQKKVVQFSAAVAQFEMSQKCSACANQETQALRLTTSHPIFILTHSHIYRTTSFSSPLFLNLLPFFTKLQKNCIGIQ